MWFRALYRALCSVKIDSCCFIILSSLWWRICSGISLAKPNTKNSFELGEDEITWPSFFNKITVMVSPSPAQLRQTWSMTWITPWQVRLVGMFSAMETFGPCRRITVFESFWTWTFWMFCFFLGGPTKMFVNLCLNPFCNDCRSNGQDSNVATIKHHKATSMEGKLWLVTDTGEFQLETKQ